jgi:hypothetical protein
MVFELFRLRLRGMFTSNLRLGRVIRRLASKRQGLDDQLKRYREVIETTTRAGEVRRIEKSYYDYIHAFQRALVELQTEKKDLLLMEDYAARGLEKDEDFNERLAKLTRDPLVQGKLKEIRNELGRIHLSIASQINRIRQIDRNVVRDRQTLAMGLKSLVSSEPGTARRLFRATRVEERELGDVENAYEHLQTLLRKGEEQGSLKELDALLQHIKNLGKSMISTFQYIYQLMILLADDHHKYLNEWASMKRNLETLHNQGFPIEYLNNLNVLLQNVERELNAFDRFVYRAQIKELREAA